MAPRLTTCAPECSKTWIFACLHTLGRIFGVSYGASATQNGLVSVEYMFKGESAHAAGAPWRGKSALDAVELMDIGWNFRREHLRLAQRSHYVITNGGDQPNVVPPNASVWYYLREADYEHIMDMWHIADNLYRICIICIFFRWARGDRELFYSPPKVKPNGGSDCPRLLSNAIDS